MNIEFRKLKVSSNPAVCLNDFVLWCWIHSHNQPITIYKLTAQMNMLDASVQASRWSRKHFNGANITNEMNKFIVYTQFCGAFNRLAPMKLERVFFLYQGNSWPHYKESLNKYDRNEKDLILYTTFFLEQKDRKKQISFHLFENFWRFLSHFKFLNEIICSKMRKHPIVI